MLSADMQCRLAEPQDLDAIATIWFEGVRPRDGVGHGTVSLGELRERIDVELLSGWSLWLAALKGDVVGMLALRKTEAILDQLFVLPSAQRRGVGTCLLQVAMREMPGGFTLRTALDNRGARDFYQQAGLRLLSTGSHPRHGYAVCYYGWKDCRTDPAH